MGNGRLGVRSKVWDKFMGSLEVALYRGLCMGWPLEARNVPRRSQRLLIPDLCCLWIDFDQTLHEGSLLAMVHGLLSGIYIQRPNKGCSGL